MQAMVKTVRTGAMALVLAGALSAQTAQTGSNGAAQAGAHGTATTQDTYQQQRQGNDINSGAKAGNTANPGFGEQVPNDHTLSGGQPHANSTYQKDRNGDQGLDLGWLGLLGLAGLFGIGRNRGNRVESTRDMHGSSTGASRS